MKNVFMLALLASVLTQGAIAQPDALNLSDLTTGSVVRVSARRPVVTLGHAVVLRHTTNELVVNQSKQTYTIQITNLVDFQILERAEPPPAADSPQSAIETTKGAKTATEAGKGTAQVSMLAAFWEKITSLWR